MTNNKQLKRLQYFYDLGYSVKVVWESENIELKLKEMIK